MSEFINQFRIYHLPSGYLVVNMGSETAVYSLTSDEMLGYVARLAYVNESTYHRNWHQTLRELQRSHSVSDLAAAQILSRIIEKRGTGSLGQVPVDAYAVAKAETPPDTPNFIR